MHHPPKWIDEARTQVIDELYATEIPLTAIFDRMKAVSPKLPMPTPQALGGYARARGLRRPLDPNHGASSTHWAEIEAEQKARGERDQRYAEKDRYCIGPHCRGLKKFRSTGAGNRMCEPCRISARNAAP